MMRWWSRFLSCVLFSSITTLYILLCVLFFFKQKTAYEMRISDWSSDVCSSDLVPKRDIEDVWIAIALHTTPGIPEHMRPTIALVTTGVEMDVPEIGRASCRERVCQYV